MTVLTISDAVRGAIVAMCVAACLSHGIARAAECTAITTTKIGIFIQAERIKSPGAFCLTHDIKAPRRYDFGGERGGYGSALLTIESPEVDIDLRGFAINADILHTPGVTLSPVYGTAFHRVALRNGRLVSRSNTGIGFDGLRGITLADFRAILEDPVLVESAYGRFRDEWSKVPASTQPADILIDGVTIQANTRSDGRACAVCSGVALRGRRNVIRNSRIEISNGQAGVLFAGPDNVIEHCTIVFKGKAATEAAAAIKLYEAHNTVIRDNDIVIESDGEAAPVAILLVGSKNVTLEDNRFYGVKTVTKMDEQSSYAVERGNQSLSRFKALFLK